MREPGKGLISSEKLAALIWASEGSGMSYGQFAACLDDKQEKKIYGEYQEILRQREQEEQRKQLALKRIAKEKESGK